MVPSSPISVEVSLLFNWTRLRILYQSNSIVTAIRMIDRFAMTKGAPPTVGNTLSMVDDSLGVPLIDAFDQSKQDYSETRSTISGARCPCWSGSRGAPGSGIGCWSADGPVPAALVDTRATEPLRGVGLTRLLRPWAPEWGPIRSSLSERRWSLLNCELWLGPDRPPALVVWGHYI